MKSVKTCVFSAFVALIFSCDGGLTVPFVNFTVQTTTLSDADLEKLQSEEGALFRYSIPAFVTVDGKSDGETARITMKQKRNFRFLIEFLRGDAIRGVFLLSTSQWISLILVPIGLWILLDPSSFKIWLNKIRKGHIRK